MRFRPDIARYHSDMHDDGQVGPGSFDEWWHRWTVEPAHAKPRPAGVFDALLGGTTHSSADRAAADNLTDEVALRVGDWASTLVDYREQAVQAFTVAGCRQWIDLGAGLPTTTSLFYHLCTRTPGGVHRLICVDNDPVVTTCIRYHATSYPRYVTVTALPGDLGAPDTIAQRLPRLGMLDLSQPVTVVAGAVLHHLTDQQATGLLTALHRILVPGSRLIVTHVARVVPDPHVSVDYVDAAMRRYHDTTAPLYPRTGGQVARLISAGWSMAPPGPTGLTDATLSKGPVVGWGLTATATRTRVPAGTHR